MITSKQNTKIKWVRSLQTRSRLRRSEQLFIVEGVRLAEEALSSGWDASLVLYTEDINRRGQTIIDAFHDKGIPVEPVTPQVMCAASDTETPQGILAVIQWQSLQLPDSLDFILITDRIRNPGNLGTILRTANAAGVQAFFTTPGTVDFLAPKVIRAGMGAHFHIPIYSLKYEEIKHVAGDMNVYLAAVDEGEPYTAVDFRLPTALIIGGEAVGASPQAYKMANTYTYIPMLGKSESLNAAIAAGVLLFEVTRQRQAP